MRDSSADAESDAVVDSNPPFDASLVTVLLDASQAFDASATTHLTATSAWPGLAGVEATIHWGDGSDTQLGTIANAASVSETHQYQTIDDFTVTVTLCLGTTCITQSLGTTSVACSDPNYDDCSGGIADGCETNVDSDIANCGACGMTCDQSSGICDAADTCVMGACQDNHVAATVECRASAGTCDVAETCDGAGSCPADAFAPTTTECRASTGVCDAAETCDGAGSCPADSVATATTICRASTDGCDAAEMCDGVTDVCPADVLAGAGSECRAAAGSCDVAETCDGVSSACPADVLVAAATECRASAGSCDVAESCDGLSAACPADVFEPATTTCRASAGACDIAETCDGLGAACPADALVAAAVECRASAGACDVAESCDGLVAACPTDAFEPATTECRASAGVCDVAESCTGSAAACPADALAPTTTECRASVGACDVAETCDGASVLCPVDALAAPTVTCRVAAGACDVAETCDGVTTACPVDALEASGTECRAQSGVCDVAETCDGATAACPTDAFVALGTECRAQNGVCDVAEQCSGGSGACPADSFVALGTECRASAGSCDSAESCTGSDGACPADGRVSAGTECRAAAGACDVAETCDGSAVACPTDDVAPATTVCRASGGSCDLAETCDGSTTACPADAFEPSTTVCRGSAGVCDVVESCTGASAACPADAFQSNATVCRVSGGVCDLAESCTGASAACPADAMAPSTTVCRASGGVCDLAETCTGSAAACPADAMLPSTTVCRGSAGGCDVAENCTGGAAACPADAFRPSTTVCRVSAGTCDVAENCSGSAAACPADAFSPSTTVCRASGGVCDVAENCTGSASACPADAFSPSTTVCRADADGAACDAAESCSGSAAACPTDGTQPAGTTCNLGGPNGMCLANGTCQVAFGPDTTFGGGDGDIEGTSPSPSNSEDSNRTQAAVRINAGTHAGKLLVAGTVSGSLSAAFVARYNANGTIDTTFGPNGSGYAYYPNVAGSGAADGFYGLAIQTDGKIIAAGYSNGSTTQDDVTVARLNEDGTYDNTFGTGGRLVVNNLTGGNNLDRAADCVLQADGKILVVGITRLTGGSINAMFVMRVNTNGTLDATFGGPSGDNATDIAGVVTDSGAAGGATSPTDQATSVAVTSTGLIYVGGYGRNPAVTISPVLWRFTSNGRRDTTWDGDGRLVSTLAQGVFDAVTLDASNRPVVGGNDQGGSGTFQAVIARATTAGAWDTTFDGDGHVLFNSAGTNGCSAGSVGVQTDGKVVFGGTWGAAVNDNDLLTARLGTNGAVDASFSGDGWDSRGTIAGATRTEDSAGLAILPTGEIVNMGNTERPAPFTNFYWYDSAVVRYTTAGALDATFGGGDGIVNSGTTGWRTDAAYDVAIQSNGAIVTVGYTNVAGGGSSSENAAIWRATSTGAADTTWNGTGGQYYDSGSPTPQRELFFAVEIAAGDKPVVAGQASPSGTGSAEFAVFQYTTAGALDTTFNATGIRSFTPAALTGGGTGSAQANDLAIQSDNAIVAVGSTNTAASNTDMVVVRLTSAGAIDTTFAGDGTFNHNQAAGNPAVSSAERGYGVAIQSDGKIVIVGAGATGTVGNGDDMVVWRLNANGTLDTSFDTDGFMSTGAASAAGVRNDAGRSVLIQPDGKIVIGGTSTDANSFMHATVWRLTAAGALDTTFNGTGYYVDPQPSVLLNVNEAKSGIARDTSGNLYLAWTRYVQGGGHDVALWRLTSAGALDTTFGTSGIFTQHNGAGGNGRDHAHGMVRDGSGRFVVAGQSRGVNTNDLDGILWRFQ